MAFHLYQSNKLKALGYFFTEVAYSQSDMQAMLKPHRVIVQSVGMGTWLKYFLADHDGIAANIEFPFILKFMNERLAAFAEQNNYKILDRDAVTHRIYSEIQNHEAKYPEIQAYIRGGSSELKTWQIAVRIADLFDQYQAYAPNNALNSLLAEASWQRDLYHAVFDGYITQDALVALYEPSSSDAGEIINIFGVSSMPLLYLQFFEKLSKVWDVNFFYLNPVYQNWEQHYRLKGSVENQIEQLKNIFNYVPLSPHTDVLPANPLLNSFGKLGQRFFQSMMQVFPEKMGEAAFIQRESSTALQMLQHDITMDETPLTSSPNMDEDASISIHNCHTTMREVEVLHDQLLNLIEKSPELKPRDMIVMAPNIENYVGAIELVFGNPTSPFRQQYTIADRSLQESSIHDIITKILKLGMSRYGVNDVFLILSYLEVYEKFGLTGPDLPKVKRWLHAAMICWGEDAEMRKTQVGYAFEKFSWHYGLQRLLLGMTVYSDTFDDSNFAISGVDCVEGNDAVILGRVIQFTETLFAQAARVRTPKTLAEWGRYCLELVNGFILENARTQEELQHVIRMFSMLEASTVSTAYPHDVFMEMMKTQMTSQRQVKSFLRGKLTFCSLLPMRSIPMKVVAVLGLNHDSFPRVGQTLNFNLLMRPYKQNLIYYKTARDEDKFLFLEALLSAEDYLLLFYQGQSAKNSDVYPPSIPLMEVAGYLKARFNIREQKHCLQGYSTRYFSGQGGYFSYDENNLKIAQSLSRKTAFPYYQQSPENATINVNQTILLEDLLECLLSPMLYHLKYHMQLKPTKDYSDDLSDDEVMIADPLYEYGLRQFYAQCRINKMSDDEIFTAFERRTDLTLGAPGQMIFNKISTSMKSFPDEVMETLRRVVQSPFELKIGDYFLIGTLPTDSSTQKICATRYAKFNYKDATRLWVYHLINNILHPMSDSVYYLLEGAHKVNGISREEALTFLEELIQIYVMAHFRILPYFGAYSFVAFTNKNFDYVSLEYPEIVAQCFNFSELDFETRDDSNELYSLTWKILHLMKPVPKTKGKKS